VDMTIFLISIMILRIFSRLCMKKPYQNIREVASQG